MVSKAVGIDLGTTNSSMAIVIDGKPEIIQLGTNDDRVLRSALYFSTIGGQNRVFYVQRYNRCETFRSQKEDSLI